MAGNRESTARDSLAIEVWPGPANLTAEGGLGAAESVSADPLSGESSVRKAPHGPVSGHFAVKG